MACPCNLKLCTLREGGLITLGGGGETASLLIGLGVPSPGDSRTLDGVHIQQKAHLTVLRPKRHCSVRDFNPPCSVSSSGGRCKEFLGSLTRTLITFVGILAQHT